MTSIGDRLRQERLRRGLDIERLAEQTKINPSMLEAIEADDLEKLPGSFFTRSFVRQYARALGLDEDEFEPELKRLTSVEETPDPDAEEGREELGFPPPALAREGSGGRNRHLLGALIAFVLIVAACSAIYTLWQKTHDTSTPARAADVTVAPRKEAPAPEKRAPEPAPATNAATPATSPAPEQKPASPAAEMANPPAPTAPEGQPQPSVPPGGTAPIRIQMRATSAAWVRLIADGKVVYSGTLQPNESRNFEGQASVNLRVGDPAALEVTWNEKPVGEIGPRGQPRTVQFTPEDFKVLSSAPPRPTTPSDGL
jgi:cytoskeletal protein RodZ